MTENLFKKNSDSQNLSSIPLRRNIAPSKTSKRPEMLIILRGYPEGPALRVWAGLHWSARVEGPPPLAGESLIVTFRLPEGQEHEQRCPSRGRSPRRPTWKWGLETHLASCRKRGSMIFTNSDGSMTSRISSNSFRNMTSFGLWVFGQYLRSAITTYRRENTGVTACSPVQGSPLRSHR